MFYNRTNAPISPKVKVKKLSPDGNNKNDFFVADVIGGKDFGLNKAGYPRSDIALINEQSDIRVAESILRDMAVYPEIQQSAKTDSEIMLSHRSKYCQTASENISFFERELTRLAALRDVPSPSVEPSSKVGVDPEDSVS